MLYHGLKDQGDNLVDGLDELHPSTFPLFERAMDDPTAVIDQFLLSGGELINNGDPTEPVDLANISYRYEHKKPSNPAIFQGE